jgi:hypothetical protein
VLTQSEIAGLSLTGSSAVPEPSMMVIGTLFGLGGLVAKRRMKAHSIHDVPTLQP